MQVYRILAKLFLFCVCAINVCNATEISEETYFNGKSEFYQWIEGNDPSTIHFLEIKDLWSSRRFEFNPKQHFEEKDLDLTTQLFQNLTFLKLNQTVMLKDESLTSLSNLGQLSQLEIKGDYLFSKFTDHVFNVIAEAAPKLESLTLEGPFPKINGKSLEAFNSMPNLNTVVLSSSYHHCNFNDNIYQIGFMIKSMNNNLKIIVNGIEIN